MYTILAAAIAAILISSPAYATSAADISLLSIDLKYNEEDGVKICEMQQGLNSAYQGTFSLDRTDWMTAEKLAAHLSQHGLEVWFCRSGISGFYLSVFKKQKSWREVRSFSMLMRNFEFLRKNKRPVINRGRISDYHGIVVALYRDIGKEKLNKLKGVIVLNSAFLQHFGDCDYTDKLTMSELFSNDEMLRKLRPKWKFYQKREWRTLAEEIQKDFSTERLVIKPRSGKQGNGVIIFERKEVSALLERLFGETDIAAAVDEENTLYWSNDPHSEFLVEEFFPSDPVSDKNFPGKKYDATMRVVALLTSDNGRVDIDILCSFWKLPKKALSDSGTLIEKHRSCYGSDERYLSVSSEQEEKIAKKLREGLATIYSQILQ